MDSQEENLYGSDSDESDIGLIEENPSEIDPSEIVRKTIQQTLGDVRAGIDHTTRDHRDGKKEPGNITVGGTTITELTESDDEMAMPQRSESLAPIKHPNNRLGASRANPAMTASEMGSKEHVATSSPIVKKRTVRVAGDVLKMRVVTYNLWSDPDALEARVSLFVQLCRRGGFDLIGLQEVTPRSYELIRQHLEDRYHVIQTFIKDELPVGDCLLCRREVCRIVEPACYDYPGTTMARKLLAIEIRFRDFRYPVHVMVTQLESGASNAGLRQQQCHVISKIIQESAMRHVILLGDFNLYNEGELVERWWRLAGFQDVWVALGCAGEVRATYDSSRNPRLHGQGGSSHRARPDRILVRWASDYIVRQVRLLGLGIEAPGISDHFGVLAEIVLRKNTNRL